VSLEKTIRRLRREATANPKKAAVLGLMLLVALYFWAPLVWGWVGKPAKTTASKAPDPNASLVPQFSAAMAAAGPAKTVQPEAPQHPWHVVAEWIDGDPHMQPASLAATARDPFRRAEPQVEKKAALNSDPVKTPVTAEAVGLVLSGTIIGPIRRVAVISGKTYREGATIEVNNKGQKVKLKLLEITPQQTVLQYEDARWVLKLPASSHAGRIEPSGRAD